MPVTAMRIARQKAHQDEVVRWGLRHITAALAAHKTTSPADRFACVEAIAEYCQLLIKRGTR